MNPIDTQFQRLRSQKRKAFIPFLTAGDPDISATVRVARALAAHGASMLEIGFPYSDPIADGPVIQASYTRALDRGLRLDDVFTCTRAIADTPEFANGAVPLVAMTSYSLIHRRGVEKFLDQAKAAGFSGAIVPDLPYEESDALARLAAARDFKLIQLVTPTTPGRAPPRSSNARPASSTASALPASPASAIGCRMNCSNNWRGCGSRRHYPCALASASANRNTSECCCRLPTE